MRHSFLEILNMAGSAMWVIAAFSVIAIAVAVERSVVSFRFVDRARTLHEGVCRCLQKGAVSEARSLCERSPSVLADVYLVGFERFSRTSDVNMAAAVGRARLSMMAKQKQRLWLLGTIAATAPFVGLFGTVIGIMNGLGDISETGKNDLAIVAGPISEALYATAAGILVAVEAVILFNYFNQRLAQAALDVRIMADEFVEHLLEAPGQKVDAAVESD